MRSSDGAADRVELPAWLAEAVGGFLDHISLELGHSPRTREAYRRDLRGFGAYLPGAAVAGWEQIGLETVQGYVGDLRSRGYATSSVARQVACLRSFLRFCMAEGLLAGEFVDLIDAPKLSRRLPKSLSKQQTADLVVAAVAKDRSVEEPGGVAGGEGAAGGGLGEVGEGPLSRAGAMVLRDHAILETFYASGLRVSELADLELGELNLLEQFIRVARGKGGKQRLVPLGGPAVAAVVGYLERGRPVLAGGRGVEWVFLSKSGRRLDRFALYRMVVGYARRAGLSGRVGPHTLRHCFATHLLSGGADLRVVQELLGHSSISTTQIYTSVDSERLRAVHAAYHPRSGRGGEGVGSDRVGGGAGAVRTG